MHTPTFLSEQNLDPRGMSQLQLFWQLSSATTEDTAVGYCTTHSWQGSARPDTKVPPEGFGVGLNCRGHSGHVDAKGSSGEQVKTEAGNRILVNVCIRVWVSVTLCFPCMGNFMC